MNALPLTDPSGVVRGWMCSVCCNPSAPCRLGPDAEFTMAFWKDDAERCCRCTCGVPVPANEHECTECRAKREVRLNEIRAENAKHPHVTCEPCNGTGECSHCGGWGEVPTTEGA